MREQTGATLTVSGAFDAADDIRHRGSHGRSHRYRYATVRAGSGQWLILLFVLRMDDLEIDNTFTHGQQESSFGEQVPPVAKVFRRTYGHLNGVVITGTAPHDDTSVARQIKHDVAYQSMGPVLQRQAERVQRIISLTPLVAFHLHVHQGMWLLVAAAALCK